MLLGGWVGGGRWAVVVVFPSAAVVVVLVAAVVACMGVGSVGEVLRVEGNEEKRTIVGER